jgi:hypothetical protein
MNRVGSKLIKLMTSMNIGVKYYVNEFIYVLCQENLDAFIKLTGFGNAAGWMAIKGLFRPATQ